MHGPCKVTQREKLLCCLCTGAFEHLKMETSLRGISVTIGKMYRLRMKETIGNIQFSVLKLLGFCILKLYTPAVLVPQLASQCLVAALG